MRKMSQPKLQTDLLRSENEYRQKFRQQVSARIRDMVKQTKWKHDTHNSAIYLLK